MTTRIDVGACCPVCSPDTFNMTVTVGLYRYCGRTCGEAEITERECHCELTAEQIDTICDQAIEDAIEDA